MEYAKQLSYIRDSNLIQFCPLASFFLALKLILQLSTRFFSQGEYFKEIFTTLLTICKFGGSLKKIIIIILFSKYALN